MKTFALIALLFSFGAQAQVAAPPVWPSEIGSVGSMIGTGVTPEGRWVNYRWVDRRGALHQYTVCGLHTYKPVVPNTKGMTTIEAARAWWEANVKTDCKTDPALRPIYLAMLQSYR